MPLINSEINLTFLTQSLTCAITNSTGVGRFAITDIKPYVPAVTLSTQNYVKLSEQLKSSFKRTVDWNKYQSETKTYNATNLHLNYLIDPSFQGVNRLFVLSFKNSTNRTLHIGYYLLKVEIKDYSVKIDGRNFINQPINDIETYENIRKIVTGQGDDYTTGCLLD